MEPSSGSGRPVADGAVGPRGRSCNDDDDDNDTFNIMLRIVFEEPLSSYTGIVVLVGEQLRLSCLKYVVLAFGLS